MKNQFYPKLFEKGRLGNVVIKNRIVRNSMGTYLGNPDGTVTDRQIKAYAEAAEGGAGLIFMDNVVPVTRLSQQQVSQPSILWQISWMKWTLKFTTSATAAVCARSMTRFTKGSLQDVLYNQTTEKAGGEICRLFIFRKRASVQFRRSD